MSTPSTPASSAPASTAPASPSASPNEDVNPMAQPLADSAAGSAPAQNADSADSDLARPCASAPAPVANDAISPPAGNTDAVGTENTTQAEASTGMGATQSDTPPPSEPDVPPYDASQEDMAHEYVDYYVTNPVDLPPAAPATPAPNEHGATEQVVAEQAVAEQAADGASGPPLPPPPSPPRTGGDSTVPPIPPATQGSGAMSSSPAAPPASSAGAATAPSAPAMTLMDHLGELRSRLVRSAIVVALAFAATYSIADLIFAELMRPLLAALPPNSKLIFTALPEAFFVYLQVGFVAAIFLASPYIFYQIWGFIAPGLYDEEKKFAVPMALCSAFFFILGAAFCFLVVFPFSFTFFVGFATEDIVPMPSLSEYLSFALKMLIAFGLIFEMPLFTFFLARMGMVTAALMRKVRRYAILVIFIVAAILTPPDVMSQMLMAIPMLLLYEFSIFVAVAFGKKPKPDDEADGDTKDSKAEPAGPAPTEPAPAAAAATTMGSTDSAAPQG